MSFHESKDNEVREDKLIGSQNSMGNANKVMRIEFTQKDPVVN